MFLHRQPLWLISAASILGASGVLGQVLLWRELLVVYQGNELTTGIILGNWLLAEAIGAFVSSKLTRLFHRSFAWFAGLSILFMLILPLCMMAARWTRLWSGLSLGEPPGPAFTIVSSLLILGPTSFLHGALFPAMARIYRDDLLRASSTTAMGLLYVWESIGTLLGAVLLTLYFMTGGNGFRPVALLWVANTLVLTWRHQRAKPVQKLVVWAIPACILLGTLVCGADHVHNWTQSRQFRPYRVLAGRESPHGSWTVLDSDGQYLFMIDGQPAYLTPVPDRMGTEEFAHLPLLLHSNPRRVCVIGGGVGGLLGEILKHPSVERIDYTELDPVLLRLFSRFPTKLTETELKNPRVRIHRQDGRRFLQHPGPGYDVIWIGVPEPATLHGNRYYTVEFFRSVRQRLALGGMVVLTTPGRLAYATDELRNLQSSIYASLQSAVGQVRLMPADGRFIFLASPEAPLADFTQETMLRHLHERELDATIGMPWHLEQRLHPGWQEWVDDTFRDTRMLANTDFRPHALFHILAYHQTVHAPRFATIMRWIQNRRWALAAGSMGLLLAFQMLATRRRPGHPSPPAVLFQMATTGFAGMMMDLLVIITFQSALGYVHLWIGMLMAVFMFGAALAAAFSTHWATRTAHLPNALALCDLILCGFCALLPGFLSGAVRLASTSAFASIFLFLSINFLAGALTGLLFPFAAAQRMESDKDAARTAGILQAADLAGGWSAGLMGASLLFPLGGVYGACAALVAIKGLCLIPLVSRLNGITVFSGKTK